MFGTKLPRQKPGQPIATKTLNSIIDAIESLSKLRVGYGLSIRWVAGIPLIWWSANVVIGKHVMTPPAGIPAMSGITSPFTPGSADCTVYKFDGIRLTVTSDVVTVYNSVPTAIGGNKLIQVNQVEGYPFAVVVPC